MQNIAMNKSSRSIELEAATADLLEHEASARGLTLAEFLTDIAEDTARMPPPDLDALRAAGNGPWAPSVLAEDARDLAEFERSGEGVPFGEILAWMKSWGTPAELPMPKPRKL
jgi:hypothetical protein